MVSERWCERISRSEGTAGHQRFRDPSLAPRTRVGSPAWATGRSRALTGPRRSDSAFFQDGTLKTWQPKNKCRVRMGRQPGFRWDVHGRFLWLSKWDLSFPSPRSPLEWVVSNSWFLFGFPFKTNQISGILTLKGEVGFLNPGETENSHEGNQVRGCSSY